VDVLQEDRIKISKSGAQYIINNLKKRGIASKKKENQVDQLKHKQEKITQLSS